MTTITLPPDVEGLLIEEARKRGTTAERLAIDALRTVFAPSPPASAPAAGATLFDFLADCIGTVNGTTEALSENCGQRFVQGLRDKQQRGRL